MSTYDKIKRYHDETTHLLAESINILTILDRKTKDKKYPEILDDRRDRERGVEPETINCTVDDVLAIRRLVAQFRSVLKLGTP